MTLIRLMLLIWSPALKMNLIIAIKASYYVRMFGSLVIPLCKTHYLDYRLKTAALLSVIYLIFNDKE